MRRGDLFQIKRRLLLLFLFLPGLFFRLRHLVLQSCQIDHADSGHMQKIRVIKIPLVHLLVHHVKAFLHAVRTDMYIIGKVDHFSCLAFRSAAKGTEFLRFSFFLVLLLIFSFYDIVSIFIRHINSFLTCLSYVLQKFSRAGLSLVPPAQSLRKQKERTGSLPFPGYPLPMRPLYHNPCHCKLNFL